MTPSVATPGEPTMDQAAFEGLFTRVLKPTGAFADDLRAIGYDPQRPESRYPVRIWRDALAIACRHAFPELPREEAQRRLGQKFAQGFSATILGKLVGAILPFLGPEMLIKRIPKLVTMGATGMEVSLVDSAPGRWRLRWQDPTRAPNFMVGVFEWNIANGLPFGSVELLAEHADTYELEVKARLKQ